MAKGSLKIPQEKQEMIVKMYKEGIPAKKIGTLLEIDEATVHKYLTITGARKVSDYISTGSGKRMSLETIDKILELYREGVEVKDICNELGISSDTVSRYIKRAGLSRMTGNRVTKEDKLKMVELYTKKGMNGNKIALELGKSQSTVYRTLEKYKTTGTV